MAAPENFLWGVSRGQNATLRGQKSKKMPKMDDFDNFFFLTWGGGQVGEEPPTWEGANAPIPPLMPPLKGTDIFVL